MRKDVDSCLVLFSALLLAGFFFAGHVLAWDLFAISAAAADNGPVEGENKEAAVDAQVNCALYRAKREAVPVYARAETSSEVLGHLVLGERVCHVGEQGEFAIVDWRQQEQVNKGKDTPKREHSVERVYIRLVDLWPARDRASKGLVDDTLRRMQEYYYYWRYGGVPDDVFGPVRPLTRSLEGGPSCEAGKICSAVKQKAATQKRERNARIAEKSNDECENDEAVSDGTPSQETERNEGSHAN